MADEHRTLWHLVALVATLALAAVVAVVAVTRGERGAEPSAEPTTTPTTTATASPSPAGLTGEGPYVVYAIGTEVLGFDVTTGKSTSLGTVDGDISEEGSRQPGSGRVVALSTRDGAIWKVLRRGLQRVGAIEVAGDAGFLGSAVSLDDKRVAVAKKGPDPSVVIVDLQSGRPTVVERTTRGEYPREPLLPIAWSLGGTLVYEIPYCECGDGTPGLYALDLTTARSTRLPGTGSTKFFKLAVSQSGQALYYGTESRGRYYLRRIAAGDTGSSIIRRASDTPFIVDAISQDGRLLLVRRAEPESERSRLELYSAEGERQPELRGVPDSSPQGLAMLPDDIYVIRTFVADRTQILVIQDGIARTVAEASAMEHLAYIGWLR